MTKSIGSQIRQKNGLEKSGRGIRGQSGQKRGMCKKHHQKYVQGGRSGKREN